MRSAILANVAGNTPFAQTVWLTASNPGNTCSDQSWNLHVSRETINFIQQAAKHENHKLTSSDPLVIYREHAKFSVSKAYEIRQENCSSKTQDPNLEKCTYRGLTLGAVSLFPECKSTLVFPNCSQARQVYRCKSLGRCG